jgi:hypothetical protein
VLANLSGFWFQPGPAAAGYGVAADSRGGAGAYLSVEGLRDGTFGLLGRVALVPLVDTLIVLRHSGAKAVAFAIHFATAIVVLISAGLLFVV